MAVDGIEDEHECRERKVVRMKRFLQICGLVFIASSAVALANLDEKLLEKNEGKVAQLRVLKNVWKAL
jgi:predicted lysophospholipase L1 biosynthesis ABC-type transport system permease subunit